MKTKLLTRNLYLGMLMMLVLAFGVQGIADALTFGTRKSTDGDLITVSPHQTFTIKFYPQVKRPAAQFTGTKRGSRAAFEKADATASRTASGFVNDKSAASGLTAENAGDYYYYDRITTPAVSGGDRATTMRTWLSESAAYYYNDEAVTIDSDITLMKNGTTVSVDGSTDALTDRPSDSNLRLSSSITLTGSHPTAGAFDIVIQDSTDTGDFPANAQPPTLRSAIQFTVYVVNDRAASPASPTLSVESDTNYKTDGNDYTDQSIATVATTHLRIEYSVVKGSGKLYVQKDAVDATATLPAFPLRKSSSLRTLSTSNAAEVRLDMSGTTNTVRATVAGATPTTAIFIFGYPTVTQVSGDSQEGVFGGRLEDPLVVSIKDGKNKGISGLPVVFDTDATGAMFTPVLGTTVYTTDAGVLATTVAEGTTTETARTRHGSATDIIVQTDSRGEAKTYFQLGTAADPASPTAAEMRQSVEVEAGGSELLTPFRFEAGTGTRKPVLSILSGNNQRTDENGELENPLVVVVTQNGLLKPDEDVTFRTKKGTVNNSKRVTVATDASGQAQVTYEQDPDSGNDTVTASISGTNYDREKIFYINGGAPPSRRDPPDTDGSEDDTNPTVTLTVSPTSIEGTPGSTQTLSVTASAGASVGIGSLTDTFITAGGSVSPNLFTGSRTTTLTLPSTAGTYSLTVSSGTLRRTVSVRVAAATVQKGRLSVTTATTSAAPGTTDTVTVTARDADGDPVSGVSVTLSITSGGGTLSPTPVTTNVNGIATSILTRGSTPGSNYYITASATDDYNSGQTRVIISGTLPPGDTTRDTTRDTTAGDPEYLEIYGGNRQSGSLNTRLSEPFVVEVLDADENPVEDVRVRFRVTVGSGTFRPRVPRTDDDGFAEVLFTPTSSGRIVVAASVTGIDDPIAFTVTAGEPIETLAKVSGDIQKGSPGKALAHPFVVEARDEAGDPVEGVRVTFSVTAGGGSLSETSATTNRSGQAQTTLTLGSARGVNSVRAGVTGVDPVTFTTSVEPEVVVAAANRPPMLWVDNGTIYALVGEKAQRFIPSVENAMNLAIGGGKVYWTAKTSETHGTLNSANLDGTDAKELRDLWGVPRGIAVDVAGSKLYWTDAANRLQRANLDGSDIQNVLRNLSDPQDLAVSGGNAYWVGNGDGTDTLSFITLTDPKKVIHPIAATSGTYGSLTTAGGKIYWTEQISETHGTLHAANLDGTGAKELRTDPIWGAPVGIAVDTARSHLYWTDAVGRLQRANLDASGIHNVAKGLGTPGDIVISNSITAPTGTPSTTTTTTTASKSKADVNGDGTVDSKDVDLLIVAVAAGITDAKYDVNGDGKVDINDVVAVSANRSAGAASAPALLGTKFSAVERDRLQEQIDLLIATGDRSPAALKTLVYLQQLIAMARPEKTQLLANYPNPFNPETWIPYELATDTDVRITIYNAQGVVIRTLHLGQQSAGYYTDRERAAYWDGRNALGEQVASGVYFYQFETDEMSSMRKMVILK